MAEATNHSVCKSPSLPAGYPNEHRLAGPDLFRALLGGVSKSTFARWLAQGTLQAPVKIGGCNAWPETYMAHVVRNGTRSPITPPDAALA